MQPPTTYNFDLAHICAHAAVRSQQRGIRQAARDIVFFYGDREQPAGSGVCRLSLSRTQIQHLIDRGIITPRQAERCERLTLVTDGRSIFTNYRASRAH